MTYPDTPVQAAKRVLQRIGHGAVGLSSPPEHFEEDDEHRAFRLAARAGAVAYIMALARQVDDGLIDDLAVEEAGLVALAAECAGWLGAAGAVFGRDRARRELERAGFLVFYPAVPGQWEACYRLVAPC